MTRRIIAGPRPEPKPRTVNWDDITAWGGHVTEADTGSWLDAEVLA